MDITKGNASRRAATAALIVGLHIALVAIVARPQPPVRRAEGVAVMTVAEVPAEPKSRPAAHDVPRRPHRTEPAVEVAVPAPPMPPTCDMLGTLHTALAGDPSLGAALAPLAVGPARAIMVWNGGWSEQPETAPLHRAIIAVLASRRADCLDEMEIGPRLLFLDVNGTTVSVALGSGIWHWRDLQSSDQYQPPISDE